MDEALRILLEQISASQATISQKQDDIKDDINVIKIGLDAVESKVLAKADERFVRCADFKSKWLDEHKSFQKEQVEKVSVATKLMETGIKWGGWIVAVVAFVAKYGDFLK